ncbi:MAG: SIMPL domain-containing protein [Dehalococcoidales bacterium]|nr:SIMPL domain-containing protein [Dehalococcoidales bacterium]
MKNKLISTVGIVMAVTILLAVGAFGFSLSGSSETQGTGNSIVSQQNVGIWVTGTGKVSVVPDIAVLNLGVSVQKATISEVQQQAANSMAAIMAVLESYNIAEKDIQTTNYSIYPVWNWDKDGKQILIGYSVINTITVKIRNTDDAGAIIDAVVSAGGEYTIVNSISFTVDNPETYYNQAREAAMDNAKGKATQLAELSGVVLGTPTYIYDGSYTPSNYYYGAAYDGKEVSVPTGISTGEVDITLSVQVVYSID